ncbi:NIPSNAP family protein [Paraburkholderia tagetis]|uniref:NIPSNAP family protein n=1 Tax=Paraburkholderia tagetis TaxID=2913261 RepID=A0A9X1RNV7_9BURK|nr:NIPSNAP family protein [Paraburkholderia tagetis]MCG5073266.1 NIPSNAP family protein [Paraburkholderia tagetis]
MLIEHRVYTLAPGTEASFWDAQRERGAHGLRPILERLVGTYAARSGAMDQIVSLYRYDSFEDWHTRLFGLYRQAELQPYFRAVRPLIRHQESRLLAPAPLPELTPLWGNGRDWLPAHGPAFASPRAQSVMEELTLTFAAGGVPACWEAMARHALTDDTVVMTRLCAGFSTIAGTLNQVLLYWQHPDFEAALLHRQRLRESARWNDFLRDLAPVDVHAESRLLAPSRVADMSPLYAQD